MFKQGRILMCTFTAVLFFLPSSFHSQWEKRF